MTADDIQRLERLTGMKINERGPSLYSLDAESDSDQHDFYSGNNIVGADGDSLSSGTNSSFCSYENVGDYATSHKRLKKTIA